jgi:ubiquinone/menaquinone biosynthesis C-methylase UbiE
MSNEVHRSAGLTEEHSHHHKGKSSEKFLDKGLILKALNIQPGQTILDAGCGNGYMSKSFSQLVTQSGKVYALDPDADAIEVLRNQTQGTNIEALVGDITRPTPVKPSSVDLIYISAVIHGFSQQKMKDLVGEVKRLLKPGAVLAIVEIDKKETPMGPPLEIRFSPEELQETVPLAPLNTVRAGEHFYMQIFKNTQET